MLPLSVMCHFAPVALEENKAGPLRHAEPAASADRAKLWHNPLLLLLHITSPFLSCSVQKTGSLPRLESVVCFLYGHVEYAFMVSLPFSVYILTLVTQLRQRPF